jgi:hypothetical protein
MRIYMRKGRIAFSHFFYALVATTILIALFGALILGRLNKPTDCSWRNQSWRSKSQVTRVDWHCANRDYIATRQ